tara:strand:- start:719 stop:2632 length:1914 start_codon:yes stop_codon:yes gene_type:complete
MTSSYSPSEQQYIDADGDGQTDVLVLGGSPPPEKLDEKQIKYFTTLIQDNPTNSPWPDKIKEIKTLYSGQLPDTAVPWTTLQKDNFSSDLSKSYLSRSELYKKSNTPDVKAASATTGKTILTASKELKSFAVKTENALTNFINLATKADDFLLDLPGEIKGVTSIITNAAKGYVGKIGNALSEALIGGIKSGLDGVASKIFGAFKRFKRALPRVINAQSALIKPISAVFKGLNCLGQKVADSLQGAIEDMLTGMVKNVLNAPACAINQFIGAVTAKINSAIDSFVTPLTGGISKILGPVFKVKNILSKGINLANKIGDFLSCKPKNSTDSKGTNVETIDGTGKKPKDTKEQQNIFNQALNAANASTKFLDKKLDQLDSGVDNIGDVVEEKLSDFEKEYGQWSIFGSKVSEAGDTAIGTDCYTGNIFKCGAPKIELFGGDGIGGAGKVLLGNFIDRIDPDDIYGDVRRTASLVGVEITDPGEGYTEAPLVNFTDSCDQGYGAFGEVIIDKNVNSPTYGQITSVVILSEGENYPVDLPADVSDEVYITDIIVENPGTGYENATIEDKCLTLNTVDGQIVSVEISCQQPYTTLPDITSLIVNPGLGAVLRPIMSSTPRVLDQAVLESVDCVGDFPKPGES